VARTAALVDRGAMQLTVGPQDGSFSERILTPLTARLGGLGRALTPSGAIVRLRRQLDYAGNPVAWPAERVIRVKGVGLVLMAGVGALFSSLYVGPGGIVLAAVGGAAFGFFLPDLLVYNNGVKRQEEVQKSLPDVLDMLTVCVEAGLGFDAATAQVARNSGGPLAAEFSRIMREMQIGKSRAEALRALGERTTVPELRTFSSAIVQASELGIPVAKVLREQAKEMRTKRRQRAEELAQKVPIKILFPMLFCMFPALFVVIMGPGVLRMVQLFSK
jgi:tight adherence protein C